MSAIGGKANIMRTLRNVCQCSADTPDLSDYLILTSPKRLRNPDFVIETRRWAGPTKVYVLCGIQFLTRHSTAISNWHLLIQTGCMQLLSRVAVFLAAGWWEARHALTSVRRIGAIGLPTPNVKRHPFCSRFCPRVAFSWAGRVALQKYTFTARSFGMSAIGT